MTRGARCVKRNSPAAIASLGGWLGSSPISRATSHVLIGAAPLRAARRASVRIRSPRRTRSRETWRRCPTCRRSRPPLGVETPRCSRSWSSRSRKASDRRSSSRSASTAPSSDTRSTTSSPSRSCPIAHVISSFSSCPDTRERCDTCPRAAPARVDGPTHTMSSSSPSRTRPKARDLVAESCRAARPSRYRSQQHE